MLVSRILFWTVIACDILVLGFSTRTDAPEIISECKKPFSKCEKLSCSCDTLRDSDVFIVPVPSKVSHACLTDNHSEQGWWVETGFIADGSPTRSGSVSPPAQNVTPWNLTISVCVSDIWWDIACKVNDEQKTYRAHYKCFNASAQSNLNSVPDRRIIGIGIGIVIVIVIGLAILVLIYIFRRRGCWTQRAGNDAVRYIAAAPQEDHHVEL